MSESVAAAPVVEKTAAPRKPRTKYGVTKEKFLEVWNSDKYASAAEAAAATGLPKNVAQARAANYRKGGLEVKAYPKATKSRFKKASPELEPEPEPETFDNDDVADVGAKEETEF